MRIFKRKLVATAAVFAVLSGVAASVQTAQAHHSFSATFREGAPITVEGVVTNFSYKNPHVLTYFDVTNADGTQTEWVIEGAAATLLRRRGFSADTIQPGMYIRATGDSTHDGSPMITMDSLDLINPDSGAVIKSFTDESVGSDSEGEQAYAEVADKVLPLMRPDGRPNISGNWATGAGEDTGRPRRPEPNYNAVGQARQDGFSLAHDPQVFCDAPGAFRQAGTTPHPFIITQTDDGIIIEYEEYGGRRDIPYGDSVPKPGVKSLLGDAVAQIDGDKVIITTVNLLESLASPEGTYISDEAYTVETLFRDDTETSSVLQYENIVYDPKYMTEPLRMWKTKAHIDGYAMIENDCQSPTRLRTVVSDYTSFFVTSYGVGDGANLGGLAGADAHCEMLAAGVGQGGKGWKAYLSTTGAGGVNAKDRIGSGPWYNSRGELIAANVADLLQADGLTKISSITERSDIITGRGDDVNRHDVLTGTQADGAALENGEDTTCSNWTSNGEGSALVGHHDRIGGGADPTSWTHAHSSRGCSQDNLQSTGGDGLYYCFATDFSAPGMRDESSLPADLRAQIERANLAAIESANNPPAMGPPPGQGGGMDNGATGGLDEGGLGAPDNQGKGWMVILLGLFVAGLGVLVLRRKL